MKISLICWISVVGFVFSCFGEVDFSDSMLIDVMTSRIRMPKNIALSGAMNIESAGLKAMVGVSDSFPEFGIPIRKIDFIKLPGDVGLAGDSAKAFADKIGLWEILKLSLINSKLETANWSKAKVTVNKTFTKYEGRKFIKGSIELPPESGLDFKATILLEREEPYNIYQIQYKKDESVLTWFMKDYGDYDFPEKIELFQKSETFGVTIITKIDILYLY